MQHNAAIESASGPSIPLVSVRVIAAHFNQLATRRSIKAKPTGLNSNWQQASNRLLCVCRLANCHRPAI